MADVDGIRQIDGMAPRLVGVDESNEHFQLVGFPGPAPRALQAFDLAQGFGVIANSPYRVNIDGTSSYESYTPCFPRSTTVAVP